MSGRAFQLGPVLLTVLALPRGTAGLRAQEPAPAPAAPEAPLATVLLAKLTARDLSLPEAQVVFEQLQDRPLPVRMQRFDAVQRKYADLLRTFGKARERVQQGFTKAVPKAQNTLLGRNGTAKVATLQEQALAISRAEGLTKDTIHRDLDPLLQQLRALLLPTVAQVVAEDESLGNRVQGLRDQLDSVRGWFELYLLAMHDIDREPAGRRHVDQLHQEPDPPPAASLDEDLEWLCVSALPLNGRDAKALEANATLRGSLDAEEFLGTLELNRIRIALGLAVLRIDEKLGNAARDHSQDMRSRSFFSHESPVEGKRSFGDRAARAGTSASAENIAAGQSTGHGAIEAWWYSPGHHKNMLGGHARTGLGRSEQLWTQMFGG